MSPGKELEYKRAQRKQAQMTNDDRIELASMNMEINRWMEENLMGQSWYYEFVPAKEGRGRKGVVCRIGSAPTPEVQSKISRKIIWGGKEMVV